MKQTVLRILSFAALIGWMTVIFLLSAQTAEASSGESGKVIENIAEVVVEDYKNFTQDEKTDLISNWQGLVRTFAHFAEYTVLGILALLAAMTTTLSPRLRCTGSFLFGVIYAATDELHQMSVPGRAAQITDLIIDAFGVLVGIIAVAVAIAVVRKLKAGRKRKLQRKK